MFSRTAIAAAAIATLVAGGTMLATAGPASALTLAPAAPAHFASDTVQPVKSSCARGWHQTRAGRCAPNKRNRHAFELPRWAHPSYWTHHHKSRHRHKH